MKVQKLEPKEVRELDLGTGDYLIDGDVPAYKAQPNQWNSDWTQWSPMFLATLADTGNIRASCERAGISRTAVNNARNKVPEFKALWDEAIENAVDTLEKEARKRALQSSDVLLIFLLKNQRKSVYGDRLHVDMHFIREEAKRLALESGLEVEDIAEVIRVAEELANTEIPTE